MRLYPVQRFTLDSMHDFPCNFPALSSPTRDPLQSPATPPFHSIVLEHPSQCVCIQSSVLHWTRCIPPRRLIFPVIPLLCLLLPVTLYNLQRPSSRNTALWDLPRLSAHAIPNFSPFHDPSRREPVVPELSCTSNVSNPALYTEFSILDGSRRRPAIFCRPCPFTHRFNLSILRSAVSMTPHIAIPPIPNQSPAPPGAPMYSAQRFTLGSVHCISGCHTSRLCPTQHFTLLCNPPPPDAIFIQHDDVIPPFVSES